VRHATQDRFDRVARGELRAPAYTVAQMLHWTETDFNWHMREALRAQGYRTFHIREASETGVADLIVYGTRSLSDLKDSVEYYRPMQVIEAWIELKAENNKAKYQMDPRKAAQRQFMRDHWNEARNAIYVMQDRKVGMLAAHQGDLRGRVHMLPMSPYSVDWREVFAHFSGRKVALTPQTS
jgi:hypothetical protein